MRSGPPRVSAADETVQWTVSSDERRELGRAAKRHAHRVAMYAKARRATAT